MRTLYRFLAVMLAPLVLGSGACGSESPGPERSDTSSTPTSIAAPTTAQAPPTSEAPPTTETPTTSDAPATSVVTEQWGGNFSWTEFVEGDPGSNQTLGHMLTLEFDGEELSGQFSQLGFQTFIETDVVAGPNADGSIDIVVVDAEPARYEPGEVLFSLGGDPASPLTTLGSMITLRIDLEPGGTYFVPGTGG